MIRKKTFRKFSWPSAPCSSQFLAHIPLEKQTAPSRNWSSPPHEQTLFLSTIKTQNSRKIPIKNSPKYATNLLTSGDETGSAWKKWGKVFRTRHANTKTSTFQKRFHLLIQRHSLNNRSSRLSLHIHNNFRFASQCHVTTPCKESQHNKQRNTLFPTNKTGEDALVGLRANGFCDAFFHWAGLSCGDRSGDNDESGDKARSSSSTKPLQKDNKSNQRHKERQCFNWPFETNTAMRLASTSGEHLSSFCAMSATRSDEDRPENASWTKWLRGDPWSVLSFREAPKKRKIEKKKKKRKQKQKKKNKFTFPCAPLLTLHKDPSQSNLTKQSDQSPDKSTFF